MSAVPESTPDQKLKLRTYAKGDAIVVECEGRLVWGVTDILKTEVKRLLPETKHIVLDLTNLWQMDSMGLGTIVSLYVSAQAAGSKLELIHLSKRVRELLGMTNLLEVFGIFAEGQNRIV